jgi:hypothetical protein
MGAAGSIQRRGADGGSHVDRGSLLAGKIAAAYSEMTPAGGRPKDDKDLLACDTGSPVRGIFEAFSISVPSNIFAFTLVLCSSARLRQTAQKCKRCPGPTLRG